MTINELNELIASGATQPGVREVQEMMRLGKALDDQAGEIAAIYNGGVSWASTSSNMGPVMTPVEMFNELIRLRYLATPVSEYADLRMPTVYHSVATQTTSGTYVT